MSVTPETRAQLASLKIARDQRPAPKAYVGRRSRGGGKWVVLLLLIGAGGAGAYLKRDTLRALLASATAATAAEAAEIPVLRVELTAEPTAKPVLTATGKIVSDHLVQVNTKVSGQIVALHFEQGDEVKQGQLLARVEDVIYRAQRDQAAARLAQAKAKLEFEEYNHQRAKRLFDQNTAPELEYVNARRGVEEARAEVEAAQAALTFAQKALTDCDVLAPIAGVILERNVEVGDFVAAEGGRGAIANAMLAEIADMTILRVEVDVSELDIARLRGDMPCTITPEAYKDRTYSGHVMWIDPGANYSKATVQVKVRIDQPDRYLRVEGSAQVVFLPEEPASRPAEGERSLWIPESAVLKDDAGVTSVFVVADNQFRATTVKLGRSSDGSVEVLSGLKPGQSIAAKDVDNLRDGQKRKS